MNWVFLALLAPFIYAINVFIDKYLIEAKIPDYRGLPVFSAIVALLVALGLWIFSEALAISVKDAFLFILTGIFTIWAFSLYLEALIKEETSLLIIVIQLIPVIVLILSFLILGESVTQKQLLGFLLLLSSSILISLKRENKRWKFSKALIYVLIADILWAIPYILIKFTSSSIVYPSLIMYESIGVVIGGIFLLLFIRSVRDASFKILSKVNKPVLGLVFINEFLFLGGKTLTYIAITIGPIALVSVLGSTQVFFGILLGIILTILMPKIFKEDLSKNSLIKKGLLGVMAFVGIVLVS